MRITNKRDHLIIIVIFITTVTLLVTQLPITDGDTLFHIKLGEWIVNNKAVPRTDMFSTHENLSYTAYSYGFEVIIYLLYRIGGFTALAVARGMVFAGILIGATIFFRKEQGLSPLGATVWGCASMLPMYSCIASVRPQICSYIILFIQILIMKKWTEDKRSNVIYWIPATFLVINNLHAGVFPFHLFLVFSAGLDLVIHRKDGKLKLSWPFQKYDHKYFISLILSVATMATNPYFPDILLYPFKTVTDNAIYNVMEWNSTPLRFFLSTFLLFIIAIRFVRFEKLKTFIVFDTIVIIWMISKHLRYVAYGGIIACFWLCCCDYEEAIKRIGDLFEENWKPNPRLQKLPQIAMVFVAVCICFVSIWKFDGGFTYNEENDGKPYPVKAVEFMKENGITSGFYNSYNDGNYCLFEGLKVFVDTRYDLYSPAYNEGCNVINDEFGLEEDLTLWELLDKYDLEYALLNKNAPNVTLRILRETDKCEILYEDDYFAVIKRML